MASRKNDFKLPNSSGRSNTLPRNMGSKSTVPGNGVPRTGGRIPTPPVSKKVRFSETD